MKFKGIRPSNELQWLDLKTPGPWFNIKMSSYRYRKSHCGDKTILRPSYLHNGISYTGKMSSLYWIRAQDSSPNNGSQGDTQKHGFRVNPSPGPSDGQSLTGSHVMFLPAKKYPPMLPRFWRELCQKNQNNFCNPLSISWIHNKRQTSADRCTEVKIMECQQSTVHTSSDTQWNVVCVLSQCTTTSTIANGLFNWAHHPGGNVWDCYHLCSITKPSHCNSFEDRTPGVGVTKAPFVNFSASKIFHLSKVPLKSFESHLSLTGATAAELRRHLSNINVIFNS